MIGTVRAQLEGINWRKSIHAPNASLMEVDEELLEINPIPNVIRFPEIWEAYRDYVVEWVQCSLG